MRPFESDPPKFRVYDEKQRANRHMNIMVGFAALRVFALSSPMAMHALPYPLSTYDQLPETTLVATRLHVKTRKDTYTIAQTSLEAILNNGDAWLVTPFAKQSALRTGLHGSCYMQGPGRLTVWALPKACTGVRKPSKGGDRRAQPLKGTSRSESAHDSSLGVSSSSCRRGKEVGGWL
eukprot:6179330-Pleurochrysis_carterae.AAC.1